MGRINSASMFLIILLLASFSVTGSIRGQIPDDSPHKVWTKIGEYSTDLHILPGEDTVFLLDGAIGEVRATSNQSGLTAKTRSAIEMVPDWLKDDLELKFRVIDSRMSDRLAQQIINAQGNLTLDEIAFVIAHLSVETLNNDYFFPEIITHNAELVYAHDELIPFAKIVEKKDHTTIVYKTTEGDMELPRDIYYWFVVHPDLGDEVPTYVDPDYNYTVDQPRDRDYGIPPPEGKFWREWFFVNNKSDKPLLADLLNNTETFMDGIQAINSWITRSMTFTSDNERPNQPVRIYEKGIGRCGEYQDMRSAAGRASLLPVVPTSNPAEDHVWNEFWKERWIHWDGTYDRPHIYESGWGKTLSTVWNQRGDGYTWDVTDVYTDVSTVNVTVVDSKGIPADGTLVELKTEMYYLEDLKTTTTFANTNHEGQLSFMVGDGRNYWGTADGGELGKDPLNPNIAPKEIEMDTGVGEQYDVRFNLPLAASSPNHISTTPVDNDTTYDLSVNVSYEVLGHTLRSQNPFTGDTFEKKGERGDITVMMLNQRNMQSYEVGTPFNSFYYSERSHEDEFSFPLYQNEDYSLVFDNRFSQATVKHVNVTLTIWGYVTSSISQISDPAEISEPLIIEGYADFMTRLDSVHTMIRGETGWIEAILDHDDVDRGNWISTMNLEGVTPGDHILLSRARGDENISHYCSRGLTIVDETAPEITITDMPTGPYMDSEILPISGKARDHHKVSDLYFFTGDDPKNQEKIKLTDEEWSIDIDLSLIGFGIHSLTIEAIDPSGNIGSRIIEIRILESLPPYVIVDRPVPGQTFKQGGTINIHGETRDNIGVEELLLFMDGREIADITGSIMTDSSFSYDLDISSIPIADGDHTIEVSARDASGNRQRAKVQIFIDGKGPIIEITSRIPELMGSHSRVSISGKLYDESEIKQLEWAYENMNWEDVTRSIRRNNFDFDIPALQGNTSKTMKMMIRARDILGNENVKNLFFFFDASGPSIEVNDVPSIILKGGDLSLSGHISDDSGIGGVTVFVDGLGELAEFKDRDTVILDIDIPTGNMKLGEMKIQIKAKDSVENIAVYELKTRLVTQNTDTDGDGIPDIWEYMYGLDPDKADSHLDTDGDGFSNLQEYLGNDGKRGNDDHTDPLDPNSFPEEETRREYGILFLIIMVIVIFLMISFVLFLLIKMTRRG